MNAGRSMKKNLLEVAVRGAAEAKARIFGHVVNPTSGSSSQKILRKNLIGEKVVSWYPYDIRRDDPAWVAQKEQVRLNRLEQLKRRGKGPPKKGQGKRAAKKSSK